MIQKARKISKSNLRLELHGIGLKWHMESVDKISEDITLPSDELRLKAVQLKFICTASNILVKMLKAHKKKKKRLVLYLWEEIWEFITC